ncbi:tRNA dihydrouridine synthase DusB [Marinicella rhabdoformis]|uniref:tRNA dihydrouridine synthase DusB n=1 Tax=Marinicella rhabdoformis TaxID=2580566 RepID=UPI0012AED939|nr:tRNA dihydrouridine synthase DusB [Marinicella rhabdoformis]
MHAFSIGPYHIPHPVMLAPMAGVTDRPFRQMCRNLGASFVVSEMLSCDLSLLKTAKTQFRMNHEGEPGPIAVQIAGAEPKTLAEAALFNQQNGAQIIDINMGCPQKKVAKKKCGSALMAYPDLVAEICQAAVTAVDIPVTLKTRLGVDSDNQNILEIAQIAEQSGIKALFIHGRTKAQKFKGSADFKLIKQAKAAVSIPVIANGDIDTPEKAQAVLEITGCDGIMIGRAAQGNPWIFKQIQHYLETGTHCAKPTHQEIVDVMYQHVKNLHNFYGEFTGCRMARKHIKWFLKGLQLDPITRQIMKIEQAEEQLKFIQNNLIHKVA